MSIEKDVVVRLKIERDGARVSNAFKDAGTQAKALTKSVKEVETATQNAATKAKLIPELNARAVVEVNRLKQAAFGIGTTYEQVWKKAGDAAKKAGKEFEDAAKKAKAPAGGIGGGPGALGGMGRIGSFLGVPGVGGVGGMSSVSSTGALYAAAAGSAYLSLRAGDIAASGPRAGERRQMFEDRLRQQGMTNEQAASDQALMDFPLIGRVAKYATTNIGRGFMEHTGLNKLGRNLGFLGAEGATREEVGESMEREQRMLAAGKRAALARDRRTRGHLYEAGAGRAADESNYRLRALGAGAGYDAQHTITGAAWDERQRAAMASGDINAARAAVGDKFDRNAVGKWRLDAERNLQRHALRTAETDFASAESKGGRGGLNVEQLREDALKRQAEAQQKLVDIERQHLDLQRSSATAEQERMTRWRDFAASQQSHFEQVAKGERERIQGATESFGAANPMEMNSLLELSRRIKSGAGVQSVDEAQMLQRFGVGKGHASEFLTKRARSGHFGEILQNLDEERHARDAETKAKIYAEFKVELQNTITANLQVNENSLIQQIASQLLPQIAKLDNLAARTVDLARMQEEANANKAALVN